MDRTFLAALLVVATVSGSSCGARSSLQATAAASGAGGSSSSTGSTSGTTSSSGQGAGGSGGQPSSTSSGSIGGGGAGGSSGTGGTGGTGGGPVLACPAIQIATPVLTVADPGGGDSRQPSLVLVNAPPATAAIVYASQGMAVTGSVGRVGGFAGWGAWPPTAPVPVGMNGPNGSGAVPGISLLAVSKAASPGASFALLYRDAGGFEMGLLYEGIDGSAKSGSAGGSAGTAVALAANAAGDGLFGGISMPDGASFAFKPSVVLGSEGLSVPAIGCATTPIAAGVAATTEGWSLAVALGTAFQWDQINKPCAQKFSTIGPATTLYFARVDPMGSVPGGTALGTMIEAPATRIRVAQRSGGSWAVWGMEGVASLAGARLGLTPNIEASFSFGAQVGTLATTSFDVQRFGDGLLIAAVDVAADGTSSVNVVFLDSTGNVTWSALVPAEGTIDDAVSLAVAPAGDALLVAWSEIPAGATTHRVRVARLDCIPGP